MLQSHQTLLRANVRPSKVHSTVTYTINSLGRGFVTTTSFRFRLCVELQARDEYNSIVRSVCSVYFLCCTLESWSTPNKQASQDRTDYHLRLYLGQLSLCSAESYFSNSPYSQWFRDLESFSQCFRDTKSHSIALNQNCSKSSYSENTVLDHDFKMHRQILLW